MQSMSMLLLLTFLISASYAMIGAGPRGPPRDPPKRNKKARGNDKECCQLNKGFDFAGRACVISGDPHYTMFNGGKHDFQGQPMMTTDDGDYKDAFYYVARCAGKTVDDLPFQILATHFYGRKAFFDRTSVTLVDYLTFELIDQDGTEYYMYFSSHIRAFAKVGRGVDVSYDLTLQNAPGALKEIELDTQTQIGETFSVIFSTNAKQPTATDMTMTVTFRDNGALETADVFVQMRGTTGKANNDPYTPYPDRDRYYQAVYIRLDDEWKCGTCGLCGQFVTSPSNSAQSVQTCDGEWTAVVDGSSVQAAYDSNGWTYEKNYYDTECGLKYDMKKDGKGKPGMKCPAWKEKIATAKCNAAMSLASVKTCCAKIGSTQCNRLKKDCYEDACLLSGDSRASIQLQVDGGLTNEIKDLCNIKGVKKNMKNQNLLPFTDLEYSHFDDEVDDVFDEPENDGFNGFDDDNDDVINDIFNEPQEPIPNYNVYQPMTQPKASQPSDYVLSLTASDLLIIALVMANIVVLTAVAYCVCSRSRKAGSQKYVSVKMVADTEDEEQAQFVQ